jgi:hypothetical protein
MARSRGAGGTLHVMILTAAIVIVVEPKVPPPILGIP